MASFKPHSEETSKLTVSKKIRICHICHINAHIKRFPCQDKEIYSKSQNDAPISVKNPKKQNPHPRCSRRRGFFGKTKTHFRVLTSDFHQVRHDRRVGKIRRRNSFFVCFSKIFQKISLMFITYISYLYIIYSDEKLSL